jgi:hypothetical protein
VKPGDRVCIEKAVVLIHPRDLRFLEQCAEAIEELPVGIESVIDEDEDTPLDIPE